MKAVIGIQARMGSKRFPGKVLEEFAGLSVLEHVYRRCEFTGAETYVLTPDTEADERLQRFCFDKGLNSFTYHGEENDVLSRYCSFADELKPDTIVRVTADCPLVSAIDVIMVLGGLVAAGLDYVSNVEGREYPRMVPDGLDVEAFTLSALLTADVNTTDPSDREHVTTWMKRKLKRRGVYGRHIYEPHEMDWRWTVDTEEDLVWLREVSDRMDLTPARATGENLRDFLRENPEMIRRAEVPA